MQRFLATVSLVVLLFAPGARADAGFDDYLQTVRSEALARGISAATLDAALTGLETDPRVIGFDRKQPEFTQTFAQYLESRVTDYRVRKAREYFAAERELLERIGERYGVDPQFIVAFWGLESSFGQYQGKYSVVRSLATLGYDPRRTTFFTEQLYKALQILDEGHVTPEAFVGGWAGAMGQNQFMPGSFLRYAQDFDGDGRKDIWSSRADVFASIAYYLKENGWQRGRGWGAHVSLPEGFDAQSLKPEKRPKGCRAYRNHTRRMQPAAWRQFGVESPASLDAERHYAMLVPTDDVGESYLVGGNYRSILAYNCANKYAVSVGLLADLIIGD